ncbi:MAG TPA: CsbD family protein [Candidatus Limnocylindria bacterium]
MKDKIEGKGDEAKGAVKEEAGKLGGDKSTELGGKWDQTKGHVKEGIGDAKMNVDKK